MLTENEIISELKKLYIFEGISENTIEKVLKNGEIQKFEPNTIIINQGDNSNSKAYIILEGEVSVFIDSNFVAHIGKGNIFGEYALICDEQRSATIKTNTPLIALVIDKEIIFTLVAEDININKIITSRIEENMKNGRGNFGE
ncbi:MAG: cyclic nucleotide-binding domain-containing protein [Candidatus Gracilibacteria bacterium]|nr:cyclic nucleotide-binding domain-containing protein [Candidatus Gracilibacteria bacterium]MDD3119794.1 cyclic nucleotide-binding domain-containing protein [Candidatus Gracilibacteria bacterium]MDD4530187.1 cyclic nucleotide-binding domain-containing protein [Candidatus Gracilibacteria bacterium]